MGETLKWSAGNGGSNAQTNTTANRFSLRSGLLRSSKIRISIAAAIVAISAAAIIYASSSRQPVLNNVSNHEGVTSTVQPANDQNTGDTQPKLDPASTATPVNNSATNSNTTRVTVNGHEVTVPANGDYEQSTTSDGTQTTIRVNNRQQSSSTGGNSSNHSSSNFNISVQSDSPPQ